MLSHHPNIRVERDDHVATVTIDRPESKNACTGDMWVALGATFRELSYSGVRAIVLTGAGGEFCTGADLGGGAATARRRRAAARRPGTMVDAMRVLADVVLAIHDCPVPVVAKVDGLCVGAGLGLALAADLTWCSDRARFSAIFAKRGLSLDFGTSWLLRQRIGVHKAKELAFTAKMFSGTEAFELGLVNAVVPADELDDADARDRRDDRRRSADRAVDDEARARQRVDVVARAGARDRGARAERQRADRRPARGADRVHGTPPADVHGPVARLDGR